MCALLYALFSLDTFLSLSCAGKERKVSQKKEYRRYSKEILKLRNENFRPLSKYKIRYGKFSFLRLKISNCIPSGLRPEPPTAHIVSRCNQRISIQTKTHLKNRPL